MVILKEKTRVHFPYIVAANNNSRRFFFYRLYKMVSAIDERWEEVSPYCCSLVFFSVNHYVRPVACSLNTTTP